MALLFAFRVPPLKLKNSGAFVVGSHDPMSRQIATVQVERVVRPAAAPVQINLAVGVIGLARLPLQSVMAPLFRLTSFAPLLLPVLKRRAVLAFKFTCAAVDVEGCP